jgi:hypothetical protein
MVRPKFIVPSTYDEIIDDPETGLVAGVSYSKKKKPSLRRRLWIWITRGWKAAPAEEKPQPHLRQAVADTVPLPPMRLSKIVGIKIIFSLRIGPIGPTMTGGCVQPHTGAVPAFRSDW